MQFLSLHKASKHKAKNPQIILLFILKPDIESGSEFQMAKSQVHSSLYQQNFTTDKWRKYEYLRKYCKCVAHYELCVPSRCETGVQGERPSLHHSTSLLLYFYAGWQFFSLFMLVRPTNSPCPARLTRVLMDYREFCRSIKQFLLTERGVTVWKKSI